MRKRSKYADFSYSGSSAINNQNSAGINTFALIPIFGSGNTFYSAEVARYTKRINEVIKYCAGKIGTNKA